MKRGKGIRSHKRKAVEMSTNKEIKQRGNHKYSNTQINKVFGVVISIIRNRQKCYNLIVIMELDGLPTDKDMNLTTLCVYVQHALGPRAQDPDADLYGHLDSPHSLSPEP